MLLAGCSPAKKPSTGGKTGTRDAVEKALEKNDYKAQFEKARFSWFDGKGNRLWHAQCKEVIASQSAADTRVELRGVNASLYKDGKVASTMTAPNVIADRESGEVHASGGVKIVSIVDGSTAQSDKLIWKSNEHKIIGNGSVKMTRGNMNVTASSFVSDTALKKATFTDVEISVKGSGH